MSRCSPSPDDLRRGISIVYHETSTLFTWYVWWTYVRPKVEADGDIGASSPYYSLQQNSAIQASIMSARKLAEFFKLRPGADERDDDLRAYDYPGFTALGDILTRTDLSEIHKRIAHMTYREVQAGPASYELKLAVTELIVPRCVAFFDYLEHTFFIQDEVAQRDLKKVRRAILAMAENWKKLSALLDR